MMLPRLRIMCALAAAAMVMLLALACRDSDAQRAAVDDAPCTNDATREAIDAADPDTTPDNEARCRLRRAAVTLGDLPDGWEDLGATPYGTEGVANECGIPVRFAEGLRLWYTGPGDGAPAVHQVFTVLMDEDEASRYLDAIEHSCRVLLRDGAELPLDERIVSVDRNDDRLKVVLTFQQEPIFTYLYHSDGNVVSALAVIGDLDADDLGEKVRSRMHRIGTVPKLERLIEVQVCAPLDDAGDPRTAVLERGLIELDELNTPGWLDLGTGHCGWPPIAHQTCDYEPQPFEHYVERWFRARRATLVQSVGVVPAHRESSRLAGGNCTVRYEDGTTLEIAFERAEIDSFGDDVETMRIVARGGEYDRAGLIAHLRRGDVGVEVGLRFDGSLTTDEDTAWAVEELAPLVEVAREKLEAIAGEFD